MPAPLSTPDGWFKIRSLHKVGRATISEVRSGFCSAIDFVPVADDYVQEGNGKANPAERLWDGSG
jgi:hypothetical protein